MYPYTESRDNETTSSPASSEPSQSSHAPELHRYFDKNSPATQELLQLYFDEIEPSWPLLDVPTFDAETAPNVLLRSMILLVASMKGNADHIQLAAHVFDELTATLLVKIALQFCGGQGD